MQVSKQTEVARASMLVKLTKKQLVPKTSAVRPY